MNGIYYQVVGVIKPKPRAQIGGRTEESVMIPFKTLQQASNQGDKFWFLCATADDGYSCDKMVEDIKTVLRSQNRNFPDGRTCYQQLYDSQTVRNIRYVVHRY